MRGPPGPASHSALHSEWSAWPSFSSSVRDPSSSSITRAYWYSVSASWITRPLPSVSALSVPTGSAIRRGYRRRRERPAAHRAQAPDGHDRYRQREDQEGAARAHERDQEQGREQRAQQRAGGRERVQAPGHRAGLLDRVDGEPDRPGRDGPEQEHRHGHQHEHREQRADERAGRDLVERVHRHVEQRVRHERHEGEQHRRQEGHQAEGAHVRVAVREAPAEPVADRQRHEHVPIVFAQTIVEAPK